MVCVFTFTALFLLHEFVWGRQRSTNVEDINIKCISPCPVASIRFGPGGRPWRIYKPRCSTILAKIKNASLTDLGIGLSPSKELEDFANFNSLNEDSLKNEPELKSDFFQKSIFCSDSNPCWPNKIKVKYEKQSIFDAGNIIEKPIQNEKNTIYGIHQDSPRNRLFLSEGPYNININDNISNEKEKYRWCNEGNPEIVTYSTSTDTSKSCKENKELCSPEPGLWGQATSLSGVVALEHSEEFHKNIEITEVSPEKTTDHILDHPTSVGYINIENVLSLPEIVNLKRSYGKITKRPSVSEENADSDALKKALQNFSDFITIKYLLENNENTTDSLEILEHILERLSISPESERLEGTSKSSILTETLTTSIGTTNMRTSHMPSSSTHKHTTHRSTTHHSPTTRKPSKSVTTKAGKNGSKGEGSPVISKSSTLPPKPYTGRFRPTGRVTPTTTKIPQTTPVKFSVTANPPSSNFPAFDESGLFPYSQNQSVRGYVTYMSERAACMHFKNTLAQWNLETNMSHITHKQAMVTGLELIHFQRTLNRYLEPLAKENIQDPMLQREIKLLYLPGMSILPDIKIAEFEEILFAMDTIYSSATVNKWNNPQVRLHLDDIIQAMQRSQSPEELKYYWVEWRAATGHKLRSLFEQYIELQNLTAISNGFSDAGEMWTRDYETEDFMQLVGCHWEEIRPLYQELHAYVRARLHKYYGEVAIKCNHSPIPTHLTGELWGQSWKYLYNITEPYPKANCNFNPDLKAKGLSKSKLISQTEHFFLSLGFPPLPEGFWKRSVLNKANMEMTSSPSSWDMHDGHDFRIKMCFNGTLEDYLTLYHELAYIEYFREYRNLSFPFRRGPNPAFHEGIAGALMLSIQSPAYLNKMGIFKLSNSKEGDINFLLNVALDKLAYLPYSYIVDLWRFRVFTGEIKPNDYNDKWWKMRLQYQGIIPPVRRTSEDFDPGSEYHIATNKPYLQNFISTILQFQFFEALCRKSGKISEKVPLHKCDLHNSPQVGGLLRYVMQMGASRHWRVAMKALTDSRQINSRALLEYFSPLYDWLKKENFRTGQRVGWSDHIELA